jgi:hypothetical protein
LGGLCLERVARRSETPGGWGADVSGETERRAVEATGYVSPCSGADERHDYGGIVEFGLAHPKRHSGLLHPLPAMPIMKAGTLRRNNGRGHERG